MMRLRLIAVTLALMIASFGCVNLGPDFQKPDLGFDPPKGFQHRPEEAPLKPIPMEDRWWTVFNDPEIDRTVEEALAHNLDIRQAAARILELRAHFIRTRADRFPEVGLESVAARQRERNIETDIYSLSLPASFEIDLWSRLAKAEDAARYDLLQAEENRLTTAQSVVAEAISLCFQIDSIERRIAIAERSIENYKNSLDLVNSRYSRGLVGILDVRQARRTLAQAESTLPPLRQDLGTAQQNLSVLLGRYPTTSPPESHGKDYFRQLEPVPPGLPSELLMRRPDIRAAEAGLKALTDRVGVAKAARFPRISLTGSYGYAGTELDELLDPRSLLWSIAAGLVQPLFDAGALKANQRAAEARLNSGLTQYAKTVLRAFSEVEEALLTRKEQLERRERVVHFVEEARATQRVAEGRYQRGLTDYLSVLEAQQTRFQAEQNLVLVDLAILSNRVNLHRALGGGWGKPSNIRELEDLNDYRGYLPF